MKTIRDGVYVCGVFQAPKDIPHSVMEASASAAASTEMLAAARGTMARSKQLPPELDVSGQTPRIGVFVCNCGINIGGIADVPAVREYAETLPYVVHVEDNLFTCSQDTQDKMKQVIKEKGINRVVVASCSPRTHEPLFQETIRDAGLNKYLFEMANIRDQNTWVHMNDPKAGHGEGQGSRPHGRGQGGPCRASGAGDAPSDQERPGGGRRRGRAWKRPSASLSRASRPIWLKRPLTSAEWPEDCGRTWKGEDIADLCAGARRRGSRNHP